MKPVHLMRWAPADYLLDAFVVGCYRRADYRTLAFYSAFLFRSHLEGGSLPSDVTRLADFLNMRERDVEVSLTACVQGGKLFVSDGRVYHKRVARDLEREHAFRHEQAELGKRGAAKRWGSPGGGSGGPHSGGDGQPAPLPAPAPFPVPAPTPDPIGDGAPAPDIGSQRSAFVQQLLAEWGRLGGKGRTPTNTEYALACRWFEAGVELRWALTAIEETWRREAAKGNQIRSLTYFDGAVQEESRRVAAGRTR